MNIRDTLFGDLPLDAWPAQGNTAFTAEPWASFVAAREALARGAEDAGVAAWRRITDMPDLDSRHYAQAWHFLRARGVQPPPKKAKHLLGVILEVPMHGGLDIIAVYPERTARYYNYSGSGVIWEHPNDSLDPLIDNLLRAGERILQAIGPWTEPRRTAPAAGNLRINLLAPSGLHFGEGPFQVLAADSLAKPAVDAATVLVQELVVIGQSSER